MQACMAGKNEGVMVIKQIENHGWFYPDITSVVLERTLY